MLLMFVLFFALRSCCFFFFFKQKTAYEMRISDWSSDVCSSDLPVPHPNGRSEVRDEGRIDFLKRQMVPSERPFASHKVTKILGIETTHHGRIAICPSLTKGTDQRLVAFGISFDPHRRSRRRRNDIG